MAHRVDHDRSTYTVNAYFLNLRLFFYFLCTLVYFLRYLSTKIDKYLLLSTDPPQILQTILYQYYRFYQLSTPGKRRQKYKTK